MADRKRPPDAGPPRGSQADAARPGGARSASADGITVLDSEPRRFQFARWKNVTILAWATQGNAEAIQRLERALLGIAASTPEGRSVVSIVGDKVPPPTPEARAAIVALMTRSAPQLACMAVVTVGSGFGAAVQQSVHTGVRLDSSRAYEMGLFMSVEEMGAWLPEIHEKKTKVRLDPAELVSAVTRVHRDACGL